MLRSVVLQFDLCDQIDLTAAPPSPSPPALLLLSAPSNFQFSGSGRVGAETGLVVILVVALEK